MGKGPIQVSGEFTTLFGFCHVKGGLAAEKENAVNPDAIDWNDDDSEDQSDKDNDPDEEDFEDQSDKNANEPVAKKGGLEAEKQPTVNPDAYDVDDDNSDEEDPEDQSDKNDDESVAN